jgi:hypothetical protein
LVTTAKPDSELADLVYGLTPIPHEAKVSMFHSPVFWGVVVAVVFLILQVIFW